MSTLWYVGGELLQSLSISFAEFKVCDDFCEFVSTFTGSN